MYVYILNTKRWENVRKKTSLYCVYDYIYYYYTHVYALRKSELLYNFAVKGPFLI